MLSKNYKHWISISDNKRCEPCKDMHGKIYPAGKVPKFKYKLHAFCRCIITWMQAIVAGKATNKGKDGADWWLKHYDELPDYYITETEAKQLGWVRYKGNLHKVAPGKMITRGIYYNDNNHLPVENGRIWYEADINYEKGYRGNDRILFSNDGLIFVTYDHYKTFVEII